MLLNSCKSQNISPVVSVSMSRSYLWAPFVTVWCLLVPAVAVWLFQGYSLYSAPVNKLITSTNAHDSTIKDDVQIKSSQPSTFYSGVWVGGLSGGYRAANVWIRCDKTVKKNLTQPFSKSNKALFSPRINEAS